ncbi:hypothetical protein C8R44DRAFT_632631, partial [Mycena epipterygia]
PCFPPELTDTVIDRLKDDKSALKACSGVCKQWVAGSRCHYFRSISFSRKFDRPERQREVLALMSSQRSHSSLWSRRYSSRAGDSRGLDSFSRNSACVASILLQMLGRTRILSLLSHRPWFGLTSI